MKRVILPCVLAVLAARSIPAQGGTKEEIQRLQSDVLALQNQMRLLVQSPPTKVFSRKFGIWARKSMTRVPAFQRWRSRSLR